MLITIVAFVLVLSVIVFVHELGHFWTARKFGAKVEEFGLGLPPRIVGIRKINGKLKLVWGRGEFSDDEPTIYSLNWIPVGGFVKIKGEGGEKVDDQDSFAGKPIWQRSIMLVAGVAMNVLLSIVFLSIGFGFGMPTVIGGENGGGAIVSERSVQVIQTMPEGGAKAAGVKIGDIIVSLDDQEIASVAEINEYLSIRQDQNVKVAIRRDDELIEKDIVSKRYSFEGQETVGFGVGLMETAIVRYPWYLAIWQGIKATFVWLVVIITAFVTIIKNLLFGLPTGVEVAGPVGIAALTGQAARLGLVYVLQFTALLSLNLAIINILPFPALDGGRLLFLAIEKIRGRAIKQEWENLVHNIGFIFLLGLIVLVTFGDVARYGGGLWGAIKGLFSL